jgi:small subunit ribosomal protein S20
MANIKSAQKRIKTNETKRLQNKTRISRVRTFVKKVEAAITAKDAATAQTAWQAAQPELMRAAAKNVMSKNTVARVLSRLNLAIRKIAA